MNHGNSTTALIGDPFNGVVTNALNSSYPAMLDSNQINHSRIPIIQPRSEVPVTAQLLRPDVGRQAREPTGRAHFPGTSTFNHGNKGTKSQREVEPPSSTSNSEIVLTGVSKDVNPDMIMSYAGRLGIQVLYCELLTKWDKARYNTF